MRQAGAHLARRLGHIDRSDPLNPLLVVNINNHYRFDLHHDHPSLTRPAPLRGMPGGRGREPRI
jgi:hypothetical protein